LAFGGVVYDVYVIDLVFVFWLDSLADGVHVCGFVVWCMWGLEGSAYCWLLSVGLSCFFSVLILECGAMVRSVGIFYGLA